MKSRGCATLLSTKESERIMEARGGRLSVSDPPLVEAPALALALRPQRRTAAQRNGQAAHRANWSTSLLVPRLPRNGKAASDMGILPLSWKRSLTSKFFKRLCKNYLLLNLRGEFWSGAALAGRQGKCRL